MKGPDLNEGFLKVRWNQRPSCQVILSAARAVRWSPDYGVAGGVAGAPHFTEELGDLARQNALVLQAAQQVVLGLLG